MIINYALIFILAAYSSFLTTKGLSICSDTIRLEINNEQRKFNDKWVLLLLVEIFAVYFSLSLLGNIFSFIGVLLISDLISLYNKNKKHAQIISPIICGIIGVIVFGAYHYLTSNVIFSSLIHSNEPGRIFDIFSQAYLLLPVLIIGYHFGIKKSVYTLLVTTIVYLLTSQFIKFLDPTIATFTISSLLYLLVLIINYKGRISKPILLDSFSSNLTRMNKNRYLIAIMGSIVSLAVYLNLAPNVLSLIMQSQNNILAAIILTILLAISVIPSLIASTLVSGYFSPLGFGSTSIIGLFLLLITTQFNLSSNLFAKIIMMILAVILGFLTMLGELKLFPYLTNLFDKRTHLKLMSESVSTSIYYLLDFTLIAGTLMFIITNYANKSLTMGIFWCLGLYLINRSSNNKVISSFAAGPAALILFALALSFFNYLGLY